MDFQDLPSLPFTFAGFLVKVRLNRGTESPAPQWAEKRGVEK